MKKPSTNQNIHGEKWARILFNDIESPPHYEVSNFGRLKSFQGGKKGEIIRGCVIMGYRSLNIRLCGRPVNFYVHKLVAEHFVERSGPDACFVIHLNFEKQDNYFENLKWVSQREVIKHNLDNPVYFNRAFSRKVKNYKLNESKVRVIKRMLANENSRIGRIAKHFGVSHTQIKRIISGENWGHVVI